MNRGDEQPDLAYPSVGEFQQIVSDFLVIEISVFLAYFGFLDFYPGMGFNIIIFTGVAFLQDFIDRFTAEAAKRLFVEDDRLASAVIPAVIATYFGF
jgi:hypothetical protein